MANDKGDRNVVITGGTCGGKTSSLSFLEQRLLDLGEKPLIVPETARLLLKGGVRPEDVGPRAFQHHLFEMQLEHEERFRRLAKRYRNQRVVLIHDRGLADNRAYMGMQRFRAMLSRFNLDEHSLFERYDGVIHAVTAAKGAEEFYVCDDERTEGIEVARRLDTRTQYAWVGHPHFRVVENTTDFENKKREILAHVLQLLGLPVPIEIEHKFEVLDRAVLTRLPRHARRVQIEQIYPVDQALDIEERVRKRVHDDVPRYYRAQKRRLSRLSRAENERKTTAADYYTERMRLGAVGVRKYRWYFLYEGQYFELDDYSPMGLPLVTLEIELTHEGQKVRLPKWLGQCEEVTGKSEYRNRFIAVPVSQLDAVGFL